MKKKIRAISVFTLSADPLQLCFAPRSESTSGAGTAMVEAAATSKFSENTKTEARRVPKYSDHSIAFQLFKDTCQIIIGCNRNYPRKSKARTTTRMIKPSSNHNNKTTIKVIFSISLTHCFRESPCALLLIQSSLAAANQIILVTSVPTAIFTQ